MKIWIVLLEFAVNIYLLYNNFYNFGQKQLQSMRMKSILKLKKLLLYLNNGVKPNEKLQAL